MYEYDPKCILCNYGRTIRLTGHVLCSLEGVTEPRFYCKKFELNYIKLQLKRPKKKQEKQFFPQDFSL